MVSNNDQIPFGPDTSSPHRVSVRYLSWLFDAHDQPDIDPAVLLNGVPYDRAWMADPNRMIDWESLCRIFENAGNELSDDFIVELARTSLRRSTHRVLTLFVRNVFTLRQAYHWAYGKSGLVSKTYSALQLSTVDIADGQIQIEMVAKSGLEFPRALQLFVKGQLIEAPEIFGLPSAHVEMAPINNGACYTVTHLDNATVLARLREAVSRVFFSRKAASELYASLQTEYRHLESALDALRESEARYKLLADNVDDVIWTSDLDGNLTYVSPSLARRSGVTPEQAIERNTQSLLTSAENIDLIRREIQKQFVLESSGRADPKRPRVFLVDLDHIDGSSITFEVVISILRDATGKATGILGVGRDITERTKLATRLAETQRTESLGLLAGGIAHDFNNLMGVVLGHADLISERFERDDPIQTDLAKIAASAESAAKLCDQMLAFSGKGKIIESRVNLSGRVKDLLELFGSSLPAKSEVDCQLADDLPDVLADPSQIDQVIMNLTINAGESLASSGGRIEVKTYTREINKQMLADSDWPGQAQPGMFVWLEVSDTGHGIDEDIINRIFEPFYSTKQQGRGMGLSAVAGVIRANTGIMMVDSSPSGSRFRVALPAASGAPVGDAAPGERSESNAIGKVRVLIVDDEESMRDVLEKMLAKCGHRVVAAAGGDDAVRLLKVSDDDIDLIMLDLNMPGLDGEETYHLLREVNASVPVAFMSGYHEQGLPASVTHSESVRFIHKPFRFKDLEAVIDDACRPPSGRTAE